MLTSLQNRTDNVFTTERHDQKNKVLQTVSEAVAAVQLGAGESGPGRQVQRGRALFVGPGPVHFLVLVLVFVPVLVLVLSGPEHASEDFLIQPGLAALRHIAEQASQRAARTPPAPENPEEPEGNDPGVRARGSVFRAMNPQLTSESLQNLFY